MPLMIVVMLLAVFTALGVLQVAVLSNAPAPDPAAIVRGPAHDASQQAYEAAIRESNRVLSGTPLSPAEEAARECEAHARMAAALHRSDPAQVREACLFSWRTTGRMPRL